MTFLARGRLRQLAHRDHVGPALDELFDLEADLAQVDVQVLQDVGRHAAAFLDQAQQDVLGADVFVVEPLGLLVGQLHDLAGTVGKSFVHDALRKSVSVRRRLSGCFRFGQQLPFVFDLQLPLFGAFEPPQRVELPRRVRSRRRVRRINVANISRASKFAGISPQKSCFN